MRLLVLIMIAVMTVVTAASAMALVPPQPLSELVHTGWSLKEAAPSAIWQISQTPQGDLWLASGQGVYRFDGVKFVQFKIVGNAPFVTDMIDDLFVASSGDVWIGYHGGGVSRLHDGQLHSYSTGIPPGPVKRIAEGHDGSIWTVTFGGVAVFRGGAWKTLTWSKGFGPGYNLVVAKDGVVWIATQHALLFVTPGSDRIQEAAEPVQDSWALAQAPDGRLWVSDDGWGLRALDPARLRSSTRRIPLARPRRDALKARVIMFDREGVLWGSYQNGTGIFRVFDPAHFGSNAPLRQEEASDSFRSQDGLTSSTAAPIFEDREGNVWVGTELGLDRFRRADVNVSNAIAHDSREGYRGVVASSGDFYAADEDSIYRADASGDFRKVARDPWYINELCAGRDGVIWLSDRRGLKRIEKDRMTAVSLPASARTGDNRTCTEDRAGTLWLSITGVGLFTRHHGRWRGPLPLALPQNASPRLLVAEQSGGVWAFERGRSLFLIKGSKVQSFSGAQGLRIGEIETVVSNASGTFVGGELGMARFDGDRFQSITAENYPILSLITGITQDAEGNTWLTSIHGIIKLRTSELVQALAYPGRPLNIRRFDFRDGVPGMAQQKCCHPAAFTGHSDRVWFITSRGVAWVDPKRLTFNALPPPVLIRSVSANGRDLRPARKMRLPPAISDLHIEFAAPSLSVPERVSFRYRLQGVDNDWVDPGDRRQAFYTRLPPGDYRFRVIAANNDGVWNQRGADIDFVIPPTFVQTPFFAALCGLAGLALLVMAYMWRSRQVAGRLRDRLEARLRERERIARDLHDTLLQGVQGLVLRFGAIAESAPKDGVFRREMDEALRRGEQIIDESRDHILALRTTESSKALIGQFERVGAEFENQSDAQLIIATAGETQELTTSVLEEVTKLGCEAIRNAFQHAQARMIVVEIIYDSDMLRLVVHDNGMGLPDEVLRAGFRAGHFGLVGMRERTRRIGGRLALANRDGLRLEASVPARVAYKCRGGALDPPGLR